MNKGGLQLPKFGTKGKIEAYVDVDGKRKGNVDVDGKAYAKRDVDVDAKSEVRLPKFGFGGKGKKKKLESCCFDEKSVYYVDSLENSVKKVVEGRETVIARIAAPECICLGPEGELMVSSNEKLYKVSPSQIEEVLSLEVMERGRGRPDVDVDVDVDGKAKKGTLQVLHLCVDVNGYIVIVSKENNNLSIGRWRGDSWELIYRNPFGFRDGELGVARFSSSIGGFSLNRDGSIMIISDTGNHKIRFIKNGAVKTIAGGLAGFQDGVASVARFNSPMGLCLNNEGNIIIADTGNCKIRILKNSIVQTIAGTIPGYADGHLNVAMFKKPMGVFVDEKDRIIVSDSSYVRVVEDRNVTTSYDASMAQKGITNRESVIGVGASNQLEEIMRKLSDIDGNNRVLLEKMEKMEKKIEKMESDMEEMMVIMNKHGKPPRNGSNQSLMSRQTLSVYESIRYLSEVKSQPTSLSFREIMKQLQSEWPTIQIDRMAKEIEKWYNSWKYDKSLNQYNLSEDEAKALCLYTHDLMETTKETNFYFLLNEILRKRKSNEMSVIGGYLYYLMAGLKKIPNLQATIYRGIPNSLRGRIEADYVLQRPIHWSGFASGTTDVAVAKSFAQIKGIIFEISVFSGKAIQSYAFLPEENEVLLSPNLEFKVMEALAERSDGFCYIKLQEQSIHIY